MFFGTVSGGLSSKLTGGNFWQGAAIGLTESGLNHVMHKIEFGAPLDERAKQLFGKDYKEKFGVSKLNLGSSIGKNGITTKGGDVYTYDKNSEFILVNNKEPIGGITFRSSRVIYISDYIFKHSVDFFQATLGHELIHSYHFMKGMNNLSNSEYLAYQYSIDFYDSKGWNSSKFYDLQKQYNLNCNYDYQSIPGFPIP